MHQKIIFALLGASFLSVGCITQPPSSYKEITPVPDAVSVKSQWHICRNGALADKDSLRFYLNGEYVTWIPLVFPGLTSAISIGDDNPVSTLEIKKISRDGKSEQLASKITRKTNSPNEIFVTIDSNTTGGYVVPLPFVVVSQAQGGRTISVVDKTVFDKFCGATTKPLFIR